MPSPFLRPGVDRSFIFLVTAVVSEEALFGVDERVDRESLIILVTPFWELSPIPASMA